MQMTKKLKQISHTLIMVFNTMDCCASTKWQAQIRLYRVQIS